VPDNQPVVLGQSGQLFVPKSGQFIVPFVLRQLPDNQRVDTSDVPIVSRFYRSYPTEYQPVEENWTGLRRDIWQNLKMQQHCSRDQMTDLPMISVKSKELKNAFGCSQTRTVKAKLIRFGLTIIDDEYISVQQWQALIEMKLNTKSAAHFDQSPDWTAGTTFENLKDD
jgi:hypothetical protein